jgi:ribosomal protein L7/L12
MNPASPVNAETQPDAGFSEFAMPGRMRELAARILWDLFKPLREKLAQIERAAKDEEAASELKLEKEADKLASAFATAKSEKASQWKSIAAKEEAEVSPIDQDLSRYTQANEAIARHRETLLYQFKSRGLGVPVIEARATIDGADSESASEQVDEYVRSAIEQFDDLQRAFHGPILSDFQRKKAILGRWQWGVGILIGMFILFLVLCATTNNPPVGKTFLTLIAFGIVTRCAWCDLDKHKIPQESFFFGVMFAVNEVETGYNRFSTFAVSAEGELPILIASLQREKRAKTLENDAQRERADQAFERKRTRILAEGNAAEAQHKERLEIIAGETRAKIKQLAKEYSSIAATIRREVEAFWKSTAYASAEWETSKWENWSPDSSPEFAARIGTLAISADDLQSKIPGVDFNFRLPALIPFAEGRCLLLNATGAAKDSAAEALQSVAIRALANTPPGKARFTLIDPVGLGHNVADFMHLGDFNPELINGKAWIEPQHIEQQLTKLTEDMETVIQTFLRKRYASLQDYNKEHQEIAEPFRFLVVFDFPVNFTESSARRLVSIVKNGPRCGVYTLILVDSSKKLPYDFNIEELRQSSVVFESQGVVSKTSGNKDASPRATTASSSKTKSSPPPVSPSSPTQSSQPSRSADAFAVVLKSVPEHMNAAVIKVLRSIKSGLDLAEAKRLVESVPIRVLDGVTKGEANAAKRQLEEAGALVRVGEALNKS